MDTRRQPVGSPTRSRFKPGHLLGLAVLAGGASLARPLPSPWSPEPARVTAPADSDPAVDLSVLTYNVRGLPWPAAEDRSAALARIGERLGEMRAEGRHPSIVVLQEAFTAEAKAIADTAGYPWRVDGPYIRASPGNPEGGSWYLGETRAAMLDSGLVLLSDLPVLDVARAPFPTGACAGFDCLAAKGVLLVTVSVPGKGAVTVATTHLNSRRASAAPFARTHAAYRRQAAFTARFLEAQRPTAAPMIVAGDFNRGDRPVRIAALRATLGRLGEGGLREGLAESMLHDRKVATLSDATAIRRRGRDMQFVFDGASARLEAVAAAVPFGSEADGTSRSDHFGFVVQYRVVPPCE